MKFNSEAYNELFPRVKNEVEVESAVEGFRSTEDATDTDDFIEKGDNENGNADSDNGSDN